ncbi:MAG: tripartite tricarboxylate transporter TctB family protein [Candidatus Protistobacter heckmanni]|nr:tripartite tricarboxylate transporter TctB family protein [Candidatus Protistobacter heckmanni]
MQVRSKKDLYSGLMFVVVGLAFSFIARTYSMGTTAKMGPGYFPFWLGILLAILGVIVLGVAMSPKTAEDEMDKWDVKSVLWITGSVTLFGLLLKPLGLILSLIALVFVSAMASHEFQWKGTVVNAILLVVLAYVAFVWGLGLQFPVWPAFIAQ